jgi:predicted O-linked N-acetylglucosamine transferase (SPINDLY family)
LARTNLLAQAHARGVNPQRLVFASLCEQSAHLARHKLADIVLDTLPYNAHTTASDALWAGVPLVTCMGSTFAGRVAASLLQSYPLFDTARFARHIETAYETMWERWKRGEAPAGFSVDPVS